MSRGTHSEPGLPMRNRAKTLNQNLSIRLILGQRHVRRFYQTSSQESSLAIHPATEICHKISISPSGQHTCDDQLVTCTVTALFIVGTFRSTPPWTLRTVPTKYKGFCAKLGPSGKSRFLQGLLESTKKNRGSHAFVRDN